MGTPGPAQAAVRGQFAQTPASADSYPWPSCSRGRALTIRRPVQPALPIDRFGSRRRRGHRSSSRGRPASEAQEGEASLPLSKKKPAKRRAEGSGSDRATDHVPSRDPTSLTGSPLPLGVCPPVSFGAVWPWLSSQLRGSGRAGRFSRCTPPVCAVGRCYPLAVSGTRSHPLNDVAELADARWGPLYCWSVKVVCRAMCRVPSLILNSTLYVPDANRPIGRSTSPMRPPSLGGI